VRIALTLSMVRRLSLSNSALASSVRSSTARSESAGVAAVAATAGPTERKTAASNINMGTKTFIGFTKSKDTHFLLSEQYDAHFQHFLYPCFSDKNQELVLLISRLLLPLKP
jgi:hypothetical protein